MLNDLIVKNQEGWLQGDYSPDGIIISTRIRLARNLADFPFSTHITHAERRTLQIRIWETVRFMPGDARFQYIDLEQVSEQDRQFFVERHIISRDLADANGPRAVIVDERQQCSLMLNEEDHLRMQVMCGGLNLNSAWKEINALDDWIESHVVYAWNDQRGYLTACPTNVGTGLRVSLMLHLPALVATKQFIKMYQSLQKISLTVRGLYGESSQALGDFYQISNQATLGLSEEETLTQVQDVVAAVVEYEKRAREHLLKEKKAALTRGVHKALRLLSTADSISAEDTMRELSCLRLGVNLGILNDLTIPQINHLFIQTQPAHLERLCGRGEKISTQDENIYRAQYLRETLNLL